MDDVTIVIPSYQEAETLARTLQSVTDALDRGALLIVIDDGSTDGTGAIANEFLTALGRGTLIVHDGNKGKPAALNAGLALTQTAYVLTLDGDTVLVPGALDAALLVLRSDARGQISSVAFDISVRPSLSLLAELQGLEYDGSLNFERRGQSAVDAVSVSPGAASLWRTSDLRDAGGFSSDTATEDVDITLALAALGKRARHCPRAQAYTETPATLAALLAQRRRWSLGHYQNIARHARKLGGDPVFARLTYPNFVLLSALLPAFCVLSVATLFAPGGLWQLALGIATLVWAVTIYTQRWIALRMRLRPYRIWSFLLEPLATQALHFCALMLVLLVAVKQIFGASIDVWRAPSP